MDPDPLFLNDKDPLFLNDADPDPLFLNDADPDPLFLNDADPAKIARIQPDAEEKRRNVLRRILSGWQLSLPPF